MFDAVKSTPAWIATTALAALLIQPSALAQNVSPTPAVTPEQAAAQHNRMLDALVAYETQFGSDQWRAERLRQSPRRHEVRHLAVGSRTLDAFVIYPKATTKVPVVLMVPEDQGLNNWARDMADQIAAMGVIVVVPDMLSGLGPNGGGRESFPDLRSIFAAHSDLPRTDEPRMTADLNLWADRAIKLPEANGRLAVAGFGWGGGRALWFATQRHDLSAAYVFYDAAPPPEKLAGITAPIYGFYAQIDPRVMRALPGTILAMQALGKSYEPLIYPSADHMFMRLGEEPGNPNPANVTARSEALLRLQRLIAELNR